MRDASPLAREVLRPGVVHLLPPASETGAWGAVALAQSATTGRASRELASPDAIAEG
jgi:hypothetical protein